MVRRRALDGQGSAAPRKVEIARRLRREMTDAERLLWSALRGKSLGCRVRTQHVILGWIVDFYIASAGVVIEVDGDMHDLQIDEDQRRTLALEAEGLHVLRVRNDAVLHALPDVIARIVDAVTARM
jgi:leucyl-tRNA synthetase